MTQAASMCLSAKFAEPMNQPAQPSEASVLPFTIAYFRSGWAFLIPYLAAYLLYAWLRWPVNPTTDLLSTVPPPTVLRPPCLLHVYWFLHGLHLILGSLALLAWWRVRFPAMDGVSGFRFQLSAFWPLLPWLGLALLIWIPGLYLEFPSDPIAHFGRIIEWSDLKFVTEHSVWRKSSYFLAYSMIGLGNNPSLTPMLTAFYTGASLMLSWQLYRLGVALGLSRSASFLFSSLQLLLSGNSAFSFHRYYGLASTIFAQLAVVAILRIALQILQVSSKSKNLHGQLGSLISAPALLLLIYFNHSQGVLLAAVGCAALLCWWLMNHHRTTFAAFFSAFVLASGVVAALGVINGKPMSGQDWLTDWGIFDFFTSGSPAQHRMLEICGLTGLASLVLGLVMLLRNHPGGWLMTLPWLFLLLPATATPLAVYLDHLGPEYMSVFSRQLLIVPLALPYAWVFDKIANYAAPRSPLPLGFTLSILLLAVAMPATPYGQNRAWHALMRPSQDLNLSFIWQVAPDIRAIAKANPGAKLLGGSGISYMLSLTDIPEIQYARRLSLYPGNVTPAQNQEILGHYFHSYIGSRDMLVVAPRPRSFVSPASQAAQASHHWLAQEAALATAGGAELVALAEVHKFTALLSTRELCVLTSLSVKSESPSPESRPR